MPDPLLYSMSMGATAIGCALLVLAVGAIRPSASGTRLNLAAILGISGGLAIGYYVMRLRIAWPPQNGLDRLLTIVLPAVVVIEGLCSIPRVPSWIAWCWRLSLAMASGRILLHDSVYLTSSENEWTTWQAIVTLAAAGTLLVAVWVLLFVLSERSTGIAIPISLALATQSAGIAVMLAGYIKGGAASFPLTAAMLTTGVTLFLVAQRPPLRSAVGIGVVGLFGFLFVGRFFGRLSTENALLIFLSPLLCWVSEWPMLRHRKRWFVEALRIMLVAIPLIVVLYFAKCQFDKHLAPLLGHQALPFSNHGAAPPMQA